MADLERVRVDVTAEDIRRGRTEDGWNCPIACALKRIRRPLYVSVTGFYVSDDAVDPVARLPVAVKSFVLAYDREDPVAPFSFEVELPRG